MDVVIRNTVTDDLDAIAEIYSHHVLTGVATFELTPPDQDEWRRRFEAVLERELPFVTATLGGGKLLDTLLADCADTDIGQVIAVIVDTAGTAASLALHRNRGFVDAGRLTAVGFKHGRWLDTLLLQRSIRGSTAPA